MASLNAIVHFFALLALVALVWGLLSAQKQRALLRLLLIRRQLVHMDWPWLFMRRLSLALGIKWSHVGPKPRQRPKPIQLRVLGEFLRQATIKACCLQVCSAGEVGQNGKAEPLGDLLLLKVESPQAALVQGQSLELWAEGWSHKLTAALGMPTQVAFAAEANLRKDF